MASPIKSVLLFQHSPYHFYYFLFGGDQSKFEEIVIGHNVQPKLEHELLALVVDPKTGDYRDEFMVSKDRFIEEIKDGAILVICGEK